jgi:hypothetical protein
MDYPFPIGKLTFDHQKLSIPYFATNNESNYITGPDVVKSKNATGSLAEAGKTESNRALRRLCGYILRICGRQSVDGQKGSAMHGHGPI